MKSLNPNSHKHLWVFFLGPNTLEPRLYLPAKDRSHWKEQRSRLGAWNTTCMGKKHSFGFTHSSVFSLESAVPAALYSCYTTQVLHQLSMDPYSNQKMEIYEPAATSNTTSSPYQAVQT